MQTALRCVISTVCHNRSRCCNNRWQCRNANASNKRYELTSTISWLVNILSNYAMCIRTMIKLTLFLQEKMKNCGSDYWTSNSTHFFIRIRFIRIPYYTKLRWVPFKMRFIKLGLIKNFSTKNCIFEGTNQDFFRHYGV